MKVMGSPIKISTKVIIQKFGSLRFFVIIPRIIRTINNVKKEYIKGIIWVSIMSNIISRIEGSKEMLQVCTRIVSFTMLDI